LSFSSSSVARAFNSCSIVISIYTIVICNCSCPKKMKSVRYSYRLPTSVRPLHASVDEHEGPVILHISVTCKGLSESLSMFSTIVIFDVRFMGFDSSLRNRLIVLILISLIFF